MWFPLRSSTLSQNDRWHLRSNYQVKMEQRVKAMGESHCAEYGLWDGDNYFCDRKGEDTKCQMSHILGGFLVFHAMRGEAKSEREKKWHDCDKTYFKAEEFSKTTKMYVQNFHNSLDALVPPHPQRSRLKIQKHVVDALLWNADLCVNVLVTFWWCKMCPDSDESVPTVNGSLLLND